MIDKVAQKGQTYLCHFYMLGFWAEKGWMCGISAKVAREGQTYLCQNCGGVGVILTSLN
jgi:hypothetical protein